MKLYHGSLEQIVKPEIIETNHTLDYGKGIHTEQALLFLNFIEAKEVVL